MAVPAARKGSRTTTTYARSSTPSRASQQRENEILLYHQARVFRVILSRVVRHAWTFLSEPMIFRESLPRRRAFITSIPPAVGGKAGKTDDETDEDEAARDKWSKVQGLLKSSVAIILTPNYLLIGVASFFAIAAGWSQVQASNYRSTIESYKEAAAASTEIQCS